MNSAPEKRVIVVYAGRRISPFNDKVYHLFFHGKKEISWTGIFGIYIGYLYETKKSKDGHTIARRPKSVGKKEEIPEEWFSADAAAEEYLKERREKSKADSLAIKYWSQLRPIHEQCMKLNSFDRNLFSKAIARLIVRGK